MDVTLREYIEALSAERRERLQDFIEAHNSVHHQEALSRAEAAKRIDARLEGLNELRQEVLIDRARFISREAFDAKVEALDERIAALDRQATQWQGRGEGLSLGASVLLGAVGLVATALVIILTLT